MDWLSADLLPAAHSLPAGTINVAVAQSADPDCQCRAPGGGMRDLGAVECVNIVGTRHMVRCEMSTNTPYWKQLEGVEGCPDA